MAKTCGKVWFAFYANDNSAYIPQWWALESIAVLEENMVAGMLVHRDFEEMIAKYGDTVNTRKPNNFAAKRKAVTDTVTVQDAISVNVPVVLNQLVHTSFLIYDGDESKALKDLVNEYLRPAMIAQARFIDQVVLSNLMNSLAIQKQGVGTLNGMTPTNAQANILAARQNLNTQLAPMQDRYLIWAPNSETQILNTSLFIQAYSVGDDGTALREAAIGRKLGFDHYMCQNTPNVHYVGTTVAGAINGGNLTAGSTVLTVNGFVAAIPAGAFITVAGDAAPLRVVSTVGGATPTSITVDRPLHNAIVTTAVVTVYTPGTVNNGGGYAAGWAKEIVITPPAAFPVVGQLVAFNTNAAQYTIVQANSGANTILLDRPLDVAIANSDPVNVGPIGDYNVAFHKNALALVVRPLAPPRAGVGALSAVINHNGFSMRATITYDGNKQGHLVTLDMLFGVKVLDSALVVPTFG
jgi:hypothetical protein